MAKSRSTTPYPTIRRQSLGRPTDATGVKGVFQLLGSAYRIPQLGAVQKANAGRVHQRDRGFNLPTGIGNHPAQPCLGIVLGAPIITAFSLDDDGPTARFLDEDVGAATPYEDLACVLTSRVPTSAQQAQNLAQRDVQ